MKIKFTNNQGAARKPLIKEIEDITGVAAEYGMTPTRYCYTFGEITLEHDGTLTIAGYANATGLIESLAQGGFVGEIEGGDGKVSESESAAESADSDEDTITIEVPKQGSLSDEKLQNLLKLAESRHTLIAKALGRPLIINDGGDTVQFVFPYSDVDGIAAIYSQFATAMTRYVKKHSRVTAVEREVRSEKFSMRTFLLKIGMIGGIYSATRKFFMRNLTGNASFADDSKYEAMQASRRKT